MEAAEAEAWRQLNGWLAVQHAAQASVLLRRACTHVYPSRRGQRGPAAAVGAAKGAVLPPILLECMM